jgi:hypothetical protein
VYLEPCIERLVIDLLLGFHCRGCRNNDAGRPQSLVSLKRIPSSVGIAMSGVRSIGIEITVHVLPEKGVFPRRVNTTRLRVAALYSNYTPVYLELNIREVLCLAGCVGHICCGAEPHLAGTSASNMRGAHKP